MSKYIVTYESKVESLIFIPPCTVQYHTCSYEREEFLYARIKFPVAGKYVDKKAYASYLITITQFIKEVA